MGVENVLAFLSFSLTSVHFEETTLVCFSLRALILPTNKVGQEYTHTEHTQAHIQAPRQQKTPTYVLSKPIRTCDLFLCMF